MKKIEISRARTEFLSFAGKAISQLDGTHLSRNPYLEILASELSAFADRRIKRPLLVNDANNESSQTDLQQSRSKNHEEN